MIVSLVPALSRRLLSRLGFAALAVACLSSGAAQEAEPPLEAVTKPGLTKPVLFENPPAAKTSDAEAPEATEPEPTAMPAPTKRDVDPDGDLAKMKANRIQIPEFEAIPTAQLPKLLRSKPDAASDAPDEKPGPLQFFKSDETDPEVTMEPEAPRVAPETTQPDPEAAFVSDPTPAVSGDVERLRAADTQASSFRAALAVAMDGEGNLPPAAASEPRALPVAEALTSIGDPVEVATPESSEVALPMADETHETRGWFSGLADRMNFSSPQPGSETVETVTDAAEETGEIGGEIGGGAAEAVAAPATSGFGSWFKKKPDTEEIAEAPEAPEIPQAVAVEGEAIEAPKSGPFSKLFGALKKSEEIEQAEESVQPKKSPFGNFFSANREAPEPAEATVPAPETEIDAAPAPRKTMFGRLFNKDSAEALEESVEETSSGKFNFFKRKPPTTE